MTNNAHTHDDEPDEQTLDGHRAQFPGLAAGRSRTYLNFGARGLMPSAAIESIHRGLETLQVVGPASRAGQAWVDYEVRTTREVLAELLSCDPSSVAMVNNVSTACALAIWGTPWRPGQEALVSETEPIGTWLALRQASDRLGFRIRSFPSPGLTPDWLDSFSSQLRPQTRLIVSSHIDWITGTLVSLRDLCDVVRSSPASSAQILVDGAQTLGNIEVSLDDSGVDYYAVAGQKWLGGPDGVAGLYVRPEARRSLEPTLAGWRAAAPSPGGMDVEFADSARRYESGTGAHALMGGLRAAVEVQEQFAPAATRAARTARLTRRLVDQLEQIEGLSILGPSVSSGIVSFRLGETSPAAVVGRLESMGIIARYHHHPPCVRACVHYYTKEREIDQLVAVLNGS